MTLKTTFHIIALVGLLFFSTSCSNTSYEEGDSKLSYLRTDFADATTDSQGRLSAATTDDGVSLTFTRPMQTSWSNAADSLCRVLLNYNMYANGADSNVVEPLAAKIVYTLQPAKPSVQTQAATDPVSLVSAWKSKNGNYINLRCEVEYTDKVRARQHRDKRLQHDLLPEIPAQPRRRARILHHRRLRQHTHKTNDNRQQGAVVIEHLQRMGYP